MESLPSEVKMEILKLQFMKSEELFRRYPTLLADMKKCHHPRILRCVVAYRLQEQAYGRHLKEATARYLNRICGNALSPVVGKECTAEGTKLARKWKGETYVVELCGNGNVIYNEAVYNSLTAVARLITGTRCNGREFFGVEPRVRGKEEEDAESGKVRDLLEEKQ